MGCWEREKSGFNVCGSHMSYRFDRSDRLFRPVRPVRPKLTKKTNFGLVILSRGFETNGVINLITEN